MGWIYEPEAETARQFEESRTSILKSRKMGEAKEESPVSFVLTGLSLQRVKIQPSLLLRTNMASTKIQQSWYKKPLAKSEGVEGSDIVVMPRIFPDLSKPSNQNGQKKLPESEENTG